MATANEIQLKNVYEHRIRMLKAEIENLIQDLHTVNNALAITTVAQGGVIHIPQSQFNLTYATQTQFDHELKMWTYRAEVIEVEHDA